MGAKSMSLLWPQLKNVMKVLRSPSGYAVSGLRLTVGFRQDPAVHSVTYSKKFGPGGEPEPGKCRCFAERR